MTPQLVTCKCDPQWPALAVCEACELAQLERILERRGLVAREHPIRAAYDRLLGSYDPKAEAADADDRARDAADDHRLGRSA